MKGKTALRGEAPEDGWYSSTIAPLGYPVNCPLCNYPMASWSVYDGSAWCASCGRFVHLPEVEGANW